MLQLSCIHSKCTGSIEFSWHWNQLHGTSQATISAKPLLQVNGSQTGNSGAGSGSHIGPQQSRHFAHRIGRARAFLPQRRLGIERVLERLLDAAAVLVHQPAVIVAAHAGFLDEPVRQVGAPMRAMPVEQAVLAAQIVVQNEILAHQPHRFDGIFVKLARAADRIQ